MNDNEQHLELVDVLLCDDVRRETDGRFSLMGIHPGRAIATAQLPTVLSQLAFVLRFRGSLPEDDTLHVSIEAPDEHQTRSVQGRPLPGAGTGGETLFVILAAPLQISMEGNYTLEGLIGDYAFAREFTVSRTALD
ncbi:DUF6941 family protein [Thioalbus denitrificans]|uniref:Uncharacterized protein n=1 Tax=Thioalbus denitrificans TaxID=547122 RepID=A0A369C8K4_9GAMM|nr:hypothetical protein [Thioalbus denitrificans]RCX30350.1 hypothetical protein DFQ59_105184 [Thioalbus denitrificans]